MDASQQIVQISIFIENRPGRAADVCALFDSEGINVRGFMISDTNDYGILRFVVDQPDKALDLLTRNGYAAKARTILVARLVDEPGNLSKLLKNNAQAGIDVTYSYSLISTFVAIATNDIEEAYRRGVAVGIEFASIDELLAARL